MWSAEKRAEGLEYMHPKPSSPSGRIVADSDLCHHGPEAGSSEITPEKCASSEGWHEQWVRVPPG